MNLNIKKSKFNIGDEVEILWSKKDYEGKSVRRRIIDSIMEEWRNNTFANMKTDIDGRYNFDSTKEALKRFKEIMKGKKTCELSIFKRHEDPKQWFKNAVESMDNHVGAVVIGVEAIFHHGSKIAPFNVCYLKDCFYRYKILLHGYCDMADRKNHVFFETELLEDNFKLKI